MRSVGQSRLASKVLVTCGLALSASHSLAAIPSGSETATGKPSGSRTQKSITVSPKLGIKGADEAFQGRKSNSKPQWRSVKPESDVIFDLPVTYNSRVKKWIQYFQKPGRTTFRVWLERSSRFLPMIQGELKEAGLPTDLAYVAMIESGFSPHAVSHAAAMGLWQFIEPTGKRYGLKTAWWLDERRDFLKATRAAIRYMSDLYKQFGSWDLVAASYNMGENGVRRLIKRHGTNSFWKLADLGVLPEETRDYLPKILAAILMSKAPGLYGFRDLTPVLPFQYDEVTVPGGTDLLLLAHHLKVPEKTMTELNPELLKAFVPREMDGHRIRVPKGARVAVQGLVHARSRSL